MVARTALALLLLAGPVGALTFTVDTTVDAPDADLGNPVCAIAGGGCSLRAAIQQANATAGADVVTVPAGTYVLGIVGTGEDAAATGDLDIIDEATVTGAGPGLTIVDAGGLDRVFDIGADVTLSGFTIQGGDAQGLNGGGMFIAPFGSDITVDVSEVHVTSNSANHGGGIMNEVGVVMSLSRASLVGIAATFGGALVFRSEDATVSKVTSGGDVSSVGDGLR
jgi:CSLREA domain-containing protein